MTNYLKAQQQEQPVRQERVQAEEVEVAEAVPGT